MSLVENLVEQLATSKLSLTSKPQSFNLDDMTFANLLEKQLQNSTNVDSNIQYQQMGVPAGMVIEPINSPENNGFSVSNLKETDVSDFQIKDMDIGDYFSNLLSDTKNYGSDIMKFAIKHASESYSQFNKDLVSDITDLLGDASSIT